ncbi:MAG: N-acetyl-1-D-myo-inositol-2-amino-2-deoxy-alpha-D-glucopyranoside deacetylase [Chloroflexi bacterium]|nr:N-acetyl-1-D-myo-inositol-2-amino-2-deoxy-alpha-D-glucopyranoside deacetylase [Chloroflexota bacterium]MDA8187730.1 N-acetyl-1-D-myo-inositol-2-amino-2-deoxy-alpha-D-glucopyranoside deacetylase [Dehalococcoidales bacterium]
MSEGLTLLAVHAHPDDESIGTGGVLARYSAEGVNTVVVCATDGQAGEIHDPALDPVEARGRLGAIRREELRCAARELGVRDLRFLGYRDSGMAGTPENLDPQAFINTDFTEIVGRIVDVTREVRPQVVVTYNERGVYGHPDHIMVHRATVAAFETAGDSKQYPSSAFAPWQPLKLYYTAVPRSQLDRMIDVLRQMGVPSPFDGKEFGPEDLATPDDQITTHIDVRAYLDRKRQALRCHRTQITDVSMFLSLPESVAADAYGRESFVLARTLVDVALPEDELFDGLR